MPLAFAQFRAAVDRSKFMGSDGRLYFIVSGESAAIHTIAPTLSIDLATVGGTGRGIQYGAVVWILGRSISFSEGIGPLVVIKFIVSATFLGGLLDTLCGIARQRNLLHERRPAQLRLSCARDWSAVRRCHGRAG